MRKDKKKDYKMVMLPTEVHTMLKEYCEHHGFKMTGLLSALIKQTIKGRKDR